jgi:hypothetical protein
VDLDDKLAGGNRMKACLGGIARQWLVPALALLLGGCAVTTPNAKENFKSNFRYEPVRARGRIEANVLLETSHTLSEGVVAGFKRYGNSQANIDAWREAIAEAARDDMLRSGILRPLGGRVAPEFIVRVETSESDKPEPHLTVVLSVLDPATRSVSSKNERKADLGTSIFAYTGNMRKGLSTALAELREDLWRDYQAGKTRRVMRAAGANVAAQKPSKTTATMKDDYGAAPTATRKAAPKQMSYWGFVIEDAAGQGVSLTVVKNDSPAGKAGLEVGDLLLSIDGVAVHSVQEFRAVKNRFPFFTPLNLTLKRKGVPLERTIVLYGVVPLKLKPARAEFSIPSVPLPPTSDVLSAVEALDQVNVLDQVILDPRSGKIAIVGRYDARFNTGPIPYLDMLKTALVYPKPKFNLGDPGRRSVDRLAEIQQTLWDWPTKEFVLAHPELEYDRQTLLQVWASACGVWPEELVALFNYVTFGRKDVVPPTHIRAIQGKVLRNLGYAEAAEAYDLVNQTAAEAPFRALQLLERNAEAQTILAGTGGDPAKARGALTAAVYLAIMERIHVPEAAVANLRHDLAHGRSTWQEVVVTAQGNLLPSRSSNDRREIVKVALGKIMLSPRGTKALFKKIQDVQTTLEPIDLDRTSQLTRILYEADYSLKSLVVMPQLFRHIPGAASLQEYEIRRRIDNAAGVPVYTVTQHWLEPKSVAMTVSPERRLVSFGPAHMAYNTLTFDDKGATVDGRYNEWCAGLMNNYDEYARALPAFHKVREAAKIIALANWLIAEKMRVDLSGVAQEKWDAPDTITDLWRVGLSYIPKGDDEYIEKIQIGHTGGVSFKRQNWTQVTPAPPASETGVSSQLALSAGLGQQAVRAAESGDLENARYLAELSAQAMTGKLSKGDLAKMNIVVPVTKPAPVSPAGVQLQNAMIKKTHQEIAALSQNPASAATAAALTQLNTLYDQARDNPVAASDYLVKLQTGQLSPPPAPRTLAIKSAPETVCGEVAPGDTTLSADRKAYLSKRLSEARDRLRHINEALKRLIVINAAERAEIEKLTAEISVLYEDAQERAWDVVLELLTSVSLDGFAAEQAKRLKGIDDAIAGKIALKTTPQDVASLAKIDEEIAVLRSARFRSEEAYAATEQLVDAFKMSKYGKDTDDWRRENENEDLSERTKSGLALVANLALEHPWLERWLRTKAFFVGEKLWQVAAMGKMAYYAWGFAYDILAQWAIWEPMTRRLQTDLKYNMQGMEHLRQRAEQTSKEIGCLEKLLR